MKWEGEELRKITEEVILEVNFERQSMQDRQEYKGHFSF